MSVEVLPLSQASYVSHALHSGETDWAETNCATDMWIEMLHSLGFDPVRGLAFTVATDFDGEQWAMFTYPEEDLRLLYGIEVREMNVWCPLVEHLSDHLRLGHMVAVDVNAFFLPDTRGVTYQAHHQKTTIGVQMIDRAGRRLGYFHNAGYAELEGEDFDGVLHLGAFADPLHDAMPPFALLIRPEADGGAQRELDESEQRELVLSRLRTHLERRPRDNPVSRMAERLAEDLPLLPARGMDAFHRYAFGTFRHLGANGELAASFVDWLGGTDAQQHEGLAEAGRAFRIVSSGSKTAEFVLARAAAGRKVDLAAAMVPLEEAWASAVSLLAEYAGVRDMSVSPR